MITHLHGTLVEALPTQAVVDVHGVGYEVLIPLSSFDRLPSPGQEVRLLTHLAVREDAHVLYGFLSAAERDLFRLLIHTVSGIGPKIALNVLSGMNVAAFRAAVAAADVKALASVSGVGRKTAERISVELKDKLGGRESLSPALPAGTRPVPGTDTRANDAAAALVALGFKPADAAEAVRAALAMLGPEAAVDQLVRACLRPAA
ncbi:MAG: Holliday junction branch migration protein RuvA [Verrucomicrobiota bacterium]